MEAFESFVSIIDGGRFVEVRLSEIGVEGEENRYSVEIYNKGTEEQMWLYYSEKDLKKFVHGVSIMVDGNRIQRAVEAKDMSRPPRPEKEGE